VPDLMAAGKITGKWKDVGKFKGPFLVARGRRTSTMDRRQRWTMWWSSTTSGSRWDSHRGTRRPRRVPVRAL